MREAVKILFVSAWIAIVPTAAFAQANNVTPPVAFRVIRNRASQGEVIQAIRAAGAIVSPSQLAPAAWRAEGSINIVRQLAHEGVIYLQDEASQLVAHVLGAQEGEHILDVCAAPGSKSTHIADLTNDKAFIVPGLGDFGDRLFGTG